MSEKVFVIALDGATFDLISPWVEAGLLPNLKKLMEGGLYGPLASTFPPLTGPAWGSFMTGKSPARHSVLEFFRRQTGTYQQALNNRVNLDGRSLWGLMSEAGKTVGVMGIPLSYPPEPLANGFIVTGLLTPPDSRDFTHPQTILEELEGELGEYRLRHDEKYRKADPLPFIKEQFGILENNAKAALYLMQNKPWDFFMVHFLGTDRMSHEFWHVHDESHPQHDPAERARLGNVLQNFYIAVDEKVGQLLAQIDDETHIMVMSDHGFGPITKFINFNTWLLNKGYIQLKPTLATQFRFLLFRLGFNYQSLGKLVLRLGFGKQAKGMGRAKREEMQRKIFLSLDDVDWSHTRAYSMGNFGQLFVNLRGREPEGAVEPGPEYDSLLQALKRDLEMLTDPETGERVIEEIFQKEDVYDGPYLEQSPDLMFFTKKMEYKAMGLSDFSSAHVFEPVYGTTGHHRTDGVMIWYGPGIAKKDHLERTARIQDLAPTLLYMMDVPIPRDMDGKILFEVFTPFFQAAHTPEYTEDSGFGKGNGDDVYTSEQEAKMKDVLRALGYVT